MVNKNDGTNQNIQRYRLLLENFLKENGCSKKNLAASLGISRQALYSILDESDGMKYLRNDTIFKIEQLVKPEETSKDILITPKKINIAIGSILTMSKSGMIAILEQEQIKPWMYNNLLKKENTDAPITFLYPSLRSWIFKSSPNRKILEEIIKNPDSSLLFICNLLNSKDLKVRAYAEKNGMENFSNFKNFVEKEAYKKTDVYENWKNTLADLKDLQKKYAQKIKVITTEQTLNVSLVICNSFVYFFNLYPSQTQKYPEVNTYFTNRFVYDSSSDTYKVLKDYVHFLQNFTRFI